MDFFDVKKGKYQTTVSVIHVVALVAVFTSQFYRLDKTTWQFNCPAIEYSEIKLNFSNLDSSNNENNNHPNM